MKISNLKDKLITCGILFAIVAAFIVFKLPCPFIYLFDIHCPGCGMTRAVISALQFDFRNAFNMHIMFWSLPILALYYFTDWRLFKNRKLNIGILAIIGAGFFVNWILKFF